MQFRNTTLAWSAVGLLAVGTATGLSAHGLLQTSAPAAAPAGSDPVSANPAQPIAMIAAPNYRAIVAQQNKIEKSIVI